MRGLALQDLIGYILNARYRLPIGDQVDNLTEGSWIGRWGLGILRGRRMI